MKDDVIDISYKKYNKIQLSNAMDPEINLYHWIQKKIVEFHYSELAIVSSPLKGRKSFK